MLISGLDRSAFDNKTVSFEEHIRCEHNMWHYLYFIVLVRVKNPTEYTGPESYVASMIKVLKNNNNSLLINFDCYHFRKETWIGSLECVRCH